MKFLRPFVLYKYSVSSAVPGTPHSNISVSFILRRAVWYTDTDVSKGSETSENLIGFSLLQILVVGFAKNLTLILLTWKIWWAPNTAGKWQMRFNLAFKGLTWVLCLRLRASLIFINNCPNEMQHKAVYLLFCKFTLHVSGVNHTHHQYTKL